MKSIQLLQKALNLLIDQYIVYNNTIKHYETFYVNYLISQGHNTSY